MRTGEQLALEAMKKEFKRLSRVAERAKKDADEHIEIGTEFVAIHKELAEIVNSSATGPETIKKLEELKRRRDRADKMLKKDLTKLFYKQINAELARDELGREIQMMEFRHSLRRAS